MYFGGNWTAVNLKTVLEKISWEDASKTLGDHNSIAVLLFHLHYYVQGVTKVLEGGPLETKDKYSFSAPEIKSAQDWELFIESVLKEGEAFAELIEALPEPQLHRNFVDSTYGDYYRNLSGIVEHVHYHLGQIVLIHKLLNP